MLAAEQRKARARQPARTAATADWHTRVLRGWRSRRTFRTGCVVRWRQCQRYCVRRPASRS